MIARFLLRLLRLFRLHPSSFILHLFCLLLAGSWTATVRAEPTPAPSPRNGGENVSPGAMDRSVRDVLNRREFTWRNPRAATPPPDAKGKESRPGFVSRFFQGIGDTLGEWFRDLQRWMGSDRERPVEAHPGAAAGAIAGIGLETLLYILLAFCVVGVLALLFRGWVIRRAARELAGKSASAAPVGVPDVSDEDVLADQLPEDEWLALARRLLARGEHRLALRAFYLSALSGLGGRGLLGIARHKSNRDYQDELRRRARDRAGMRETFAQLVGRFERVWYGSYPADGDLLAAFQDDRDRLAAEVAAPPVPGVPTDGLVGTPKLA